MMRGENFPSTHVALFELTSQIRQLGLKDVRRGRFQRLLQDTRSSPSPLSKEDRDLYSLPDDISCTFDHALASECSLSEFCDELAVLDPRSSSGMRFFCEGDVSGSWSIVLQQPEICHYTQSERLTGQVDSFLEFSSFDRDRFDPDSDYCYQTVSTIAMEQWDSVQYTEKMQLTKPFQKVFEQVYELNPCDDNIDSEYDKVPITGYCKSCQHAQIDDQTCNSCRECSRPDKATSFTSIQEVDCRNIDSRMEITCDGRQTTTITESFLNYSGVTCTFESLIEGHCSLEKYCRRLEATRSNGDSVICYGDTDGDWFIKLRNQEVCYYMSDYDSNGLPYDESSFNPSTDYCLVTVLRIDLHRETPLAEEFVYEITRPVKDQGVVRESSRLSPCENDSIASDYVFEKGYCYTGCPAVLIGDRVCTGGCHTCADGYEALDCSNIDDALIESCSIEHDDIFIEEVVTYFDRDSSSYADNAVPVQPHEDIPWGGGLPYAFSRRDTSGSEIRKTAEATVGGLGLAAALLLV